MLIDFGSGAVLDHLGEIGVRPGAGHPAHAPPSRPVPGRLARCRRGHPDLGAGARAPAFRACRALLGQQAVVRHVQRAQHLLLADPRCAGGRARWRTSVSGVGAVYLHDPADARTHARLADVCWRRWMASGWPSPATCSTRPARSDDVRHAVQLRRGGRRGGDHPLAGQPGPPPAAAALPVTREPMPMP